MTRSGALSRTVGLWRRYGGQNSGPVESSLTWLSQQGRWFSAESDQPPSSTPYRHRRDQLDKSSVGGDVPVRKGLLEFPCISPILARRLGVHPWRPVLGSHHFSSAQPLPAKSSETKPEDAEKEFSSKDASETSRKIAASAVDVDKAIEDYDRVLDQHRQYYASRREGTPSRLRVYAFKAWSIIPMTWNFLLRLPVMMWRAVFSSWADKRAWMQYQWKHLKDGARHYWVGTKLLAMDIRVASRMVVKVLRGKQLTRREKRQFSRTVADLFRMVPMIVFLVRWWSLSLCNGAVGAVL